MGDFKTSSDTFAKARERLDRARDQVGAAETEFIAAQRAYNDASRGFTSFYFGSGAEDFITRRFNEVR